MLGAAACGVLIVGTSIGRPAGALATTLTLTSSPTGELAVEPAGAVLTAAFPQSRAARGDLVVRNQTGVALDVRLRAKPASGELDDEALLRVTAGRATLFDGTVGELRSGSRRLLVKPGQGRRLRLAASLAADRRLEARGRSDVVALKLTSTPRPLP